MEKTEKENYYWYILFVRGGKEEKVIANIKSELERETQWSDDIQELKSAPGIIKNYVFCFCRLTPGLVRFFYKVEGVIKFLNHQRGEVKLPEPVSEEVIKKFFSQSQRATETTETTHHNSLKIGDLVQITTGSFINQEGKITHLDEKKSRVKVDIEFLGQKTSLDLPLNNCQKVWG
jgi:transcription antitermination factor NusG